MKIRMCCTTGTGPQEQASATTTQCEVATRPRSAPRLVLRWPCQSGLSLTEPCEAWTVLDFRRVSMDSWNARGRESTTAAGRWFRYRQVAIEKPADRVRVGIPESGQDGPHRLGPPDQDLDGLDQGLRPALQDPLGEPAAGLIRVVETAEDRQEPLDCGIVRVRIAGGDGPRRRAETGGIRPRPLEDRLVEPRAGNARQPRGGGPSAARPRLRRSGAGGPRPARPPRDRRPSPPEDRRAARGRTAYQGRMAKSRRVSAQAFESWVRSQR